jgi:hypothetical protein
MPIPSPLGTQKGADYITHPADHSEYLLRYRTATGISFAIGRTARSGARIRMSANDRFESLDRRRGFHVQSQRAQSTADSSQSRRWHDRHPRIGPIGMLV